MWRNPLFKLNSYLLTIFYFRKTATQKRQKRKKFRRCTICHQTFIKLEDLDAHFQTHDYKYDCGMCSERFRCLYQYSIHTSKHNDQNFTCSACSYWTDNRSNLLLHIHNVHLKNFLYYCGVCGKGFNSKWDRLEHEALHNSEKKPHACVVCQHKFSYSKNLLSHQIRYHNAMVTGAYLENQCSVCKKIFGKKATLENHVRINHDLKLKPQMCDKCGKCFPNNHKLGLHYRTHTGFKPFACDACKKCFRTKQLLDEHIRIHTGEKPYACKFCGKCFNQRTPLKVHTRMHTGEKPYVCQICGKGFTSKGALTIHTRRCDGNKVKKEELKDESDG